MRVPRMTTRRWMIAVAVVGGGLGAGIALARLNHLANRYRQAAAYHDSTEREHRNQRQHRLKWITLLESRASRHESVESSHGGPVAAQEVAESMRQEAALFESWAERDARLKEKYLRAARYPWLPIPPDPPEPE